MDTDVIVVGAGPTGLMLGAELALGGVRVQIIERRTEAHRDSRALTLHLDLAGDDGDLARAVHPGWGARVTAHTVTRHDHRTDLDGVREILIRPDGHIAWATRTTSGPARRTEREHALTSWAGRPAQA